MNTEITDVYLEDERFNPVTNCRIPGAWIAIINGMKQAFAYPHQFKTVAEARAYAEKIYHDNI